MYFLAEGDCSRKIYTESGEEFVYDRRRANNSSDNFLAEIYLYITNKISSFTYATDSGCVVHVIPQSEFYKFLSINPDIMHGILFRVINRYNDLNQNFISKRSSKTISIVSGILLTAAEYKNGKLIVDKKLSVTELSKRIGSHRVTVSKIITRLISENLIQKSPEGILILNKSALEDLAEEAADIDYML